MKRVIHLNYSDILGGAARAAYRIHQALRNAGVDSRMWVDVAASGDWTVRGPGTKLGKAWVRVRPALVGMGFKPFFKTNNPILHSPAVLPSWRVASLNTSDADILHLHWVQGEMLSVAEIGRLRKPVVWTLHDMWVFCGAEHYTANDRWHLGYRQDNRPPGERGIDLNRWVWRRKKRHWNRPMHIVTPSRWLGDCVRQSALMRDWPVSVIPNPIDTECWQPLDRSLARELLGLPKDTPLLLFGAMGGGKDPRKGFDLLQQALRYLCGEVSGLQLVVFGELRPQEPPDLGFPIHFAGHLHDDLSLRVLYSAADVFVLPSRQDNLPNTGVEALACGTPVVAFDVCGLPDIVTHQETGYLARPFDPEDLAAGIQWVLADEARRSELSRRARQVAVERFSYPVVASQYLDAYRDALENQGM